MNQTTLAQTRVESPIYKGLQVQLEQEYSFSSVTNRNKNIAYKNMMEKDRSILLRSELLQYTGFLNITLKGQFN